MRARVPLSASVAYHVSARVEDAFITLEVNRVPERGRPWHNMVEKRVRAPSGTVTLRGTLPDSLIEETDVRSIEVRATLVLVNDDTGLRHSILKSNSITFATAA